MNGNRRLAALPMWSGSRCIRCGCGVDRAELNIEAVIHHNAQLLCVDFKNCNRRARRRARQLKRWSGAGHRA